ncbi:hypothetical protein Mpet_1554 [Methanolacinia petrolearia DSM 11571]|uniref:Uncharacterized protein n=1 Tax=Methanolacinia petrolearia (strain DSM 11571 / OCM 486 / SEBR 4847) TaxID=679926 RepID=E1RGL6_METP4|nr:hypothetical protein [Methanolacinia petrolearia]ADN36311.1 hypothetical protein Mpet_1554 [Methanolacinia petrolearia DSM 11571]
MEMKKKNDMRPLFLLLIIGLGSMVFVSAASAEDIDWAYPELEIDDSLDAMVIQSEISPMKGESLYQIPTDSVIYHSPNGITSVFTQDGKQILSAIDADAVKVSVPSAGLLPATHVHQVPN